MVLLALLGATAGQGVVWYNGQFYALFFFKSTEARQPLRLHAGRPFAADRHPSSSSSLALRQDRAVEDILAVA